MSTNNETGSSIPPPPPPPPIIEDKENLENNPENSKNENISIPPPPPDTTSTIPPPPPPISGPLVENKTTPPPTISDPIIEEKSIEPTDITPVDNNDNDDFEENQISNPESKLNIENLKNANNHESSLTNQNSNDRNVESTHLTTLNNDLNKSPEPEDKISKKEEKIPEITTTTIIKTNPPKNDSKIPETVKEEEPIQPTTKTSIVHHPLPSNEPKIQPTTIQAHRPINISNSNTLKPGNIQTPQRNNKIVNSRYIEPQPIENINTHYHKRNVYRSTHNENLDDVLHRIQQRQIISTNIPDSALIAPKSDSEGWITSVGIDNPSQRGIHHYYIENSNSENPLVRTSQILRLDNEGGQILGICYMKSLDMLYYHKMNGEVCEYNPRLKTNTRIFRTNEFVEEDLIAPGCTLKEDKEGNDLLVMCSTNKIVVLHTIKDQGFESVVSLNGLTDHHFTDFQPINKDMVVSITNTGMITVHSYTPDSSSLLHYVLLNEVAINPDICAVVFSVCSQSQYMTVATYNKSDITRDKLYYLQLKDNYVPEIIDILDFENDSEIDNRDDGPIITNINMDYYIRDQPLVICSEIENEQRMQIYQYKQKDKSLTTSQKPQNIRNYEKPRLRKVFEKEGNGLGLNSKRIGRDLFSLDESGNIIKQGVTRDMPDELRKSRMTDSRYIKRSTVLGFPVSAGVTPSRVIPPGQARPQKYRVNPPPHVISALKTAIEDLGRSASPGTFKKNQRSTTPYNAESRIIDLQKVETKEFKPEEKTSSIVQRRISATPTKRISISTNQNPTNGSTTVGPDGVQYKTEVTTSPGGTRRIIKRPIRNNIPQQRRVPISNVNKPHQAVNGETTIGPDGVEYKTEITTSPGGTRRIIKRPIRKSNYLNTNQNTTPVTRTYRTSNLSNNKSPRIIRRSINSSNNPQTRVQKSNLTPTKTTTVIRQSNLTPKPQKKIVTLIKLPDGRTVPKDSPEAQEFFKGIDKKNQQNKIETKPLKTDSKMPVLHATTVVRRDSQRPAAGKLLDRSNYKRIEPESRGREFDSTKRVIINPAETPQYNTKSRLYLDNSTTQKPSRVDPVLSGDKDHSPIVHRPHSEFTPWAVQSKTTPKKTSQSTIVRKEPVKKVQVEPLTVTTVVKKDTIPNKNDIVVKDSSPQPVEKFESQLVSSRIVEKTEVRSSTPQTKKQISQLDDLVEAIENEKGLKKYQTGFEGCVNVIPVLPSWGYVNCVGKKNCLAQYEVTEDDKIKQTEILKTGQFYDGIFLKENCKVFTMENKTKSVVQIEPIPDNYDYYVVGNMKTLESHSKSLKHNEDEKLLLANTGASLIVQRISASRGLDAKRKMDIPSWKAKTQRTKRDKDGKTVRENIPVEEQEKEPKTNSGESVIFTDFCPLDNDKVITANNLAQIQAYEFRLDKKKFRKIFELDLKRFMQNKNLEITSIATSFPQNFLAVALSENTKNQKNVLHSLLIFHVSSEKPLGINNKEGVDYLNLLYTQKFEMEKSNSAYHYLNFDYQYKEVPLLIAMQMEGDRRLDAFLLEHPEDNTAQLNLKARKMKYHTTSFSAVESVCGEIVTIDFDGMMRRLKLPE